MSHFNRLLITVIGIIIVAGVYGLYLGTVGGRVFTAFLVIFIAGGFALLLLALLGPAMNEADTEEILERGRKARLEKERKEKEAINSAAEKGEWKFPALEFYQKCNAANITSFTTEYGEKKSKQIASSIMESAKIAEKYQKYYLDKLPQYYKEGKQASIMPIEGKPSPEQYKQYRLGQSIRNVQGTKKIRIMINEKISELKEQIAAEESGKLNTDLSAYKQRETDWSIAGGIAEGIAGPAAGVATAINTMSKNAEIKQHNNYVAQAEYTAMVANAFVQKDIDKLKSQLWHYERILNDIDKYFILNSPSSNEIKNALDINLHGFSNLNNVVEVRATIRKKQGKTVFDNPEFANIYLDGFIIADVHANGKYIGDAVIPFPAEGIYNHDTLNLKESGICTKSLPVSAEYTFSVSEKSKFWLFSKC